MGLQVSQHCKSGIHYAVCAHHHVQQRNLSVRRNVYVENLLPFAKVSHVCVCVLAMFSLALP